MERYRHSSALDQAKDEYYMRLAIESAEKADLRGELPVGAIVVYEEKVIALGHNMTEQRNCALRHAETEVMTAACEVLGRKTLEGCTLYVTLEPCPMCAGAIFLSRPDRVVFGAKDVEYGAFGGKFDLFELYGLGSRRPTVTGGILADDCAILLKGFFRKKREIQL